MSYPIKIYSRPCIPFAIGYSLSYAQMLEMAPRLCAAEEIARFPNEPDVNLNRYFWKQKIQEVFLRHKEADGEVRYLWVKGVRPSFDGKSPKCSIPPVDLKAYPALAGLER
ncbi:hypothetical protein DFH06DRAFT_1337688 [Mycena polygramma]|nr:hypothetical protein DFH06DRAFT_1337688 [Mycena polygramma]